MDALAKVKSYLGTDFVREVREWDSVYWVRPWRGRPTLLSKKMVDRSAELAIRYDIGGDACVHDRRTDKFYYVANLPATFDYGIAEIEKSEVGRIQRWQACRKPEYVQVDPFSGPKTPKTLRLLVVRKVNANAYRGETAA